MQFIFFDQAGKTLFVRRDAEQAAWTVETLSMIATFPYDPQKVILRAMRIGFEDETGVLQPFEIRKVETLEPDHFQRVTCEHIVISELTDRHMREQELTNVTAQAALAGILTGTGWSVGNVTASGTSSADLALGSVWQNVRTIEANWNVYITPRVTFNTSGITGKYLDIAPAQGTWRGIRLSLDKNADEVGVVIDDTEVKTALYGYGASTDGVPLTFDDVVWQQTGDHPAKPSGQSYLEDPTATADYGRNGNARFGFYQNADITDPEILLEKTWEALKATNAPRVTVNCMVRDLYRLGYADQPIRLHDTALVQIRQTSTNLQLEIIQLTVDLLDPTATRPTIGAYIPNIVYIQRDTGREASGGASKTLSGRRGGGGSGGKSAKENQLSEFETEIKQNQYQISLRAYQRDMTNTENILKEAGVAIDAGGVIIYAGNNLTQMKSAIQVNADGITAEVTNRQNADQTLSSRITQTADAITAEVTRATTAEGTMNSRITQTADAITAEVTRATGAEGNLSSRITQTADAITAEVSRASEAEGNLSSRITVNANAITTKVSAGEISSTINQTAQGVLIQAAKINLSGYVTATQLETEFAKARNLTYLTASGTTIQNSGGIYSGNMYLNLAGGTVELGTAVASIGPATVSGGQISIPWTTIRGASGTPVNFNIADTQYYKDGVSAAWTNAYNTVRINNDKDPGAGDKTINLSSGQSVEVYAQVKASASASAWSTVGTVTVNAPTYTLGSLSISSNGIYNAPTYGYTGFSYVSVDVPSSSGGVNDVTVDAVTIQSVTSNPQGYIVRMNIKLKDTAGNTKWESETATTY